jgi:hypothetical protein
VRLYIYIFVCLGRDTFAITYFSGKTLSTLSLSSTIHHVFFSFGLPGLANVPNGYSAIAEIYGKGANRSPLLVAFGFPIDWVVTLPSQDVNGEDGTIQAGEYAKGDTATFFVLPNSGKVEVCATTFD